MKKLIIYFLFFFIVFQPKTFAESNSDDLVDLQENHWSYDDVFKAVNEYKIINGYPDHTFRGDSYIKRYQLSSVILALIKQIERSKKISLEMSVKTPPYQLKKINGFYSDIPFSHWSFKTINDLNYKYRLKFFYYDTNKFSGNEYVNRYELAFIINNVISLVDSKTFDFKKITLEKEVNIIQKNLKKYNLECPSFANSCKYDWTKDSINNITKVYKIMSGTGKNSFKGENNISRYQLAATIVKTIEYIEKNYKNDVIFKKY